MLDNKKMYFDVVEFFPYGKKVIPGCTAVEGKYVALIPKDEYLDGGSEIMICPNKLRGRCMLADKMCNVLPGGNMVVRGADGE